MVDDESVPAEMPHVAGGRRTGKTREVGASERDKGGVAEVGEGEGTGGRPIGLLGEAAGELSEAGGGVGDDPGVGNGRDQALGRT